MAEVAAGKLKWIALALVAIALFYFLFYSPKPSARDSNTTAPTQTPAGPKILSASLEAPTKIADAVFQNASAEEQRIALPNSSEPTAEINSRLQVFVTDETGAAVPDFRFSVLEESLGKDTMIGVFETDGNGIYVLNPIPGTQPSIKLRFARTDYVVQTQTVERSLENLYVVLHRGQRLSGRVLINGGEAYDTVGFLLLVKEEKTSNLNLEFQTSLDGSFSSQPLDENWNGWIQIFPEGMYEFEETGNSKLKIGYPQSELLLRLRDKRPGLLIRFQGSTFPMSNFFFISEFLAPEKGTVTFPKLSVSNNETSISFNENRYLQRTRLKRLRPIYFRDSPQRVRVMDETGFIFFDSNFQLQKDERKEIDVWIPSVIKRFVARVFDNDGNRVPGVLIKYKADESKFDPLIETLKNSDFLNITDESGVFLFSTFADAVDFTLSKDGFVTQQFSSTPRSEKEEVVEIKLQKE